MEETQCHIGDPTMKTVYYIPHYVAISAGVIAQGADITNNLEWAIEASGKLVDSTNLVILSVGIGTIATAGALGAVLKSNRSVMGRLAWFAPLLLVWSVCALFSLAISADRLASQRDAKLAKAGLTAGAIQISEELLARATEKADEYCIPAAKVKPRSRDFFAAECDRWRKKIDHETDMIRRMRSEPPATGDSLGPRVQRVVEILTGYQIDPKDVGVIVPLLAPLGLLLLGSILTGWGVAGERIAPEFSFEATGKNAEEAKAQRYIQGYQEANGAKPTRREIQEALGVGQQKASRYLVQYA